MLALSKDQQKLKAFMEEPRPSYIFELKKITGQDVLLKGSVEVTNQDINLSDDGIISKCE